MLTPLDSINIEAAQRILDNARSNNNDDCTIDTQLLRNLLYGMSKRDLEIDRLDALLKERDSTMADCESEINAADRDMQNLHARINALRADLDAARRNSDFLRYEVQIAERFHKVAVAERDLERARFDDLQFRHRAMLTAVKMPAEEEGLTEEHIAALARGEHDE